MKWVWQIRLEVGKSLLDKGHHMCKGPGVGRDKSIKVVRVLSSRRRITESMNGEVGRARSWRA